MQNTKTTMRVATNGRAQIPFDVRSRLGIDAGDQLVVCIEQIIKAPSQGATE